MKEIADLHKKFGLNFLINIDGGINHERGKQCKEIGIDVIIGTTHNISTSQRALLKLAALIANLVDVNVLRLR